VALANPLSEKFAVLRPSLLPGLLDAVAYSRRRETPDVRLFEIGSVFSSEGESTRVGWMLTGARDDHWSVRTGAVDLFDAKGVAELLAGVFRVTIAAHPADDTPWLIRGRAAVLVCEDGAAPVTVGSMGQLHYELGAARGLGRHDAVFGGELDLAALEAVSRAHSSRIEPLPRYPSIVRDLSLVVDERLPAARVRGTIRAHAPGTLVSVREFDRYQGAGVPDGEISLSMRLTFRDASRTLTDQEVQQAVDVIVAALAREHGATLRGR
jgi:phenylalanyl-tRNA synthetase beta chain